MKTNPDKIYLGPAKQVAVAIAGRNGVVVKVRPDGLVEFAPVNPVTKVLGSWKNLNFQVAPINEGCGYANPSVAVNKEGTKGIVAAELICTTSGEQDNHGIAYAELINGFTGTGVILSGIKGSGPVTMVNDGGDFAVAWARQSPRAGVDPQSALQEGEYRQQRMSPVFYVEVRKVFIKILPAEGNSIEELMVKSYDRELYGVPPAGACSPGVCDAQVLNSSGSVKGEYESNLSGVGCLNNGFCLTFRTETVGMNGHRIANQYLAGVTMAADRSSTISSGRQYNDRVKFEFAKVYNSTGYILGIQQPDGGVADRVSLQLCATSALTCESQLISRDIPGASVNAVAFYKAGLYYFCGNQGDTVFHYKRNITAGETTPLYAGQIPHLDGSMTHTANDRGLVVTSWVDGIGRGHALFSNP